MMGSLAMQAGATTRNLGRRPGRARFAAIRTFAALEPPQSREDAINQARAQIKLAMAGASGSGSGGGLRAERRVLSRNAGTSRIAVEFPLPDEKDVAMLTIELVQSLVPVESTLVAVQDKGMIVAGKGTFECLEVSEASQQASKGKWKSLVLGGVTDPSDINELVEKKNWNKVVSINCLGKEDAANGWQVAYSFQPLAVQAFVLFNVEGALLKGTQGGWMVWVREGDRWTQVSSQAARPDEDELELALYNYIASSNPLVKGFKSLQSAFKK